MSDMTRWRSTVRQVLLLLNEVDPYGLEPGLPDGAPEDEYDLEAAPVAQRLIKDGAITAAQVDAIWLHWFGDTLTEVIGAEQVEQLVARLDRIVGPGGVRTPREVTSPGT